MENGGEGGRLFEQALDELGGADSRVARDVVDRLFWIERGALPARRRQRVEHLAADLEHAAFEDGEKPDRPRADDRDIAVFGCVSHGASLAAGRTGASPLGGRSRAARKQIL